MYRFPFFTLLETTFRWFLLKSDVTKQQIESTSDGSELKAAVVKDVFDNNKPCCRPAVYCLLPVTGHSSDEIYELMLYCINTIW